TGTRRVMVIVVLALIGSVAVIHQFIAREENQRGNYTAADAENSRYELWKAARSMIVAHPVLGIGSRRFKEFFQDYGEISHDNRGKVAHNTYMEVAADTGILGFGSFMLMLWGIFRSVRGVRLGDARGDGLVEIRLATFISLCAIMFRSLLDAKAYDWSYYVLAVLAIATSILASRAAAHGEATERQPAAPSEPRRRPAVSARPLVYRQRCPPSTTVHVALVSPFYPNTAEPVRAVFVRNLVAALGAFAAVSVVSPVPYAPPWPRRARWAALRSVPHRSRDGERDVFHPRFLVVPRIEVLNGLSYYAGVAPVLRRLTRARGVDVLHAHCAYP